MANGADNNNPKLNVTGQRGKLYDEQAGGQFVILPDIAAGKKPESKD